MVTGAPSVPATSQVTACARTAANVAGAACEVTRNGPAAGATVTCVGGAEAAGAGVAVAGGEPEVHRAVAVEADPVAGRQELGVAVADRRHGPPPAAGGGAGQGPVFALVLPARI